jgi:hypothetical protein
MTFDSFAVSVRPRNARIGSKSLYFRPRLRGQIDGQISRENGSASPPLLHPPLAHSHGVCAAKNSYHR